MSQLLLLFLNALRGHVLQKSKYRCLFIIVIFWASPAARRYEVVCLFVYYRMQPTAVLTIWTMVILKSAFKHYIPRIIYHIRHDIQFYGDIGVKHC